MDGGVCQGKARKSLGVPIKSIMVNDQPTAPMYNTKGQQMNNPKKGIFIQNGKKTVAK